MRTPPGLSSFLLISSSGSFTKRKQIQRNKEVLSSLPAYLLLIVAAVLIVAATVLYITALALLVVAEDFRCWCLSKPPAPGSGCAQPSLLTAPLHTASVRCFCAGAEEVLAFAAVLLSSWRCSAAAAAAAAASH